MQMPVFGKGSGFRRNRRKWRDVVKNPERTTRILWTAPFQRAFQAPKYIPCKIYHTPTFGNFKMIIHLFIMKVVTIYFCQLQTIFCCLIFNSNQIVGIFQNKLYSQVLCDTNEICKYVLYTARKKRLTHRQNNE